MFVEKYPVDILINYDFWYTKFDYRGRYEAETVKLLLGGDYVPLRDEFLQVGERKLSQKVETIMLTCGGGDKLHMLVAMLERFCSANLQNKYKIIVVTGLLNTDLSKIAAYEKKYQNIQLFVNVNNMAEIMRKADVVISAASTILYECCALQLPTIFFYVADNQQDAQGFEREGIMICAGDAQKDKNEVVENIVKNIELIREDVSMLNSMKEKMSRMIDGKGAWRIAKAICDL
jgi:spore coat polysaccharide biosynthesis predicted glycosyltransferase SpsG